MINIDKDKVKSVNLFLGGLALGTAGLRILTSKDAKKVYANVVAAGLRVKENVMNTAELVQANAEDIIAEAKDINEQREEDFFAEEGEEEESTKKSRKAAK